MTTGIPLDAPLLATTATASRLFDLSPTTLYRLRVRYPDFKALTIKTGREVLYDIPRCYKWFSCYLGHELELR